MQRSSKFLALLLSLISSVALAQGITPVGGGGGGGSGTVTSIATTCGVSGGTINVSGTIRGIATANAQTGTSYAVVDGDCGKVVTLSNGSAVAVSIAQAGTAGSFAAGWFATLSNQGAGLVTITPTTSTIDGAATLTLQQFQSVDLWTDGTNYFTARGRPTNVAIASGTAALGTGAISSATCASAVTVAATGVATTDVVTASFNGDPTAVTGYVPLTTGMLTIIPYPTANNVNFKVCNNTGSSITPGAITLNWRVVR